MSETVQKSCFRAFMCAPYGVQLVVALLCLMSASTMWNVIGEPVKIPMRLAAACLYIGLGLGLIKQKNWVRIVVVVLVVLIDLFCVLRGIDTSASGNTPILGITLVLLVPILLFVVPLYLPRSNKWFRKQDVSKEGGNT